MHSIRRLVGKSHVVSALCPSSVTRAATAVASHHVTRHPVRTCSTAAPSSSATAPAPETNVAHTASTGQENVSSTATSATATASHTAEAGSAPSGRSVSAAAAESVGQSFRAVSLQPWQRITVPAGDDRDELPSTILIHGNRLGPRPLFVLGSSRISTTPVRFPRHRCCVAAASSPLAQTNQSEEVDVWRAVQRRASVFEPILGQLAWQHGVVYVDLPVHLHVPDMLAWSCRQVCALMTALDVHWTHFLTHGYGTLVAARMACGAHHSPHRTAVDGSANHSGNEGHHHRRSNGDDSRNDPAAVSALTWERENMASTIHRIGTFVSMDTPLITQSMIDHARRRSELRKAGMDVNVPRAELQLAQEQLKESIASGEGDALPAVREGEGELRRTDMSEDDAHDRAAGQLSQQKNVGGDDGNRSSCSSSSSSDESDDARLYKEYLFQTTHMYGTSEGLQCNHSRYISIHHLAGMHHPFQLITPAQQSMCDVAAHKSFFRLRRPAVVKSAKSHADLFRSDAAVAEVAGVLSAWLSRFEPDDIIARRYAQAAKDMAQLMGSGGSKKEDGGAVKDGGSAAATAAAAARLSRKKEKKKNKK